jgi:hypothetical protein
MTSASSSTSSALIYCVVLPTCAQRKAVPAVKRTYFYKVIKIEKGSKMEGNNPIFWKKRRGVGRGWADLASDATSSEECCKYSDDSESCQKPGDEFSPRSSESSSHDESSEDEISEDRDSSAIKEGSSDESDIVIDIKRAKTEDSRCLQKAFVAPVETPITNCISGRRYASKVSPFFKFFAFVIFEPNIY